MIQHIKILNAQEYWEQMCKAAFYPLSPTQGIWYHINTPTNVIDRMYIQLDNWLNDSTTVDIRNGMTALTQERKDGE